MFDARMDPTLARAAAEHGRLAIDTEFVSERRYQAQLCLAQVAVPDPAAPDGVRTEVLDPLAPNGQGLDPTPLTEVLADPAVEVVVHSGRQDVAILRRTWGAALTNVFDTQVAAGFLGLGNQVGYETLVRKMLGIALEGGEGFTRWDRRPLTDEQLAYARDDARCLLAVGEAVERKLEEAGRLAWAREECRALEEVTDDRDPQRMYERLPKLGRLRPEQRAVALELVEWRERIARGMDRPASFVVPDHALTELARSSPADLDALEAIRGLPQQTARKRGRELLEVIERGKRRDAPPPPEDPPRRDSRDAPLVALAQALVRHRAMESGVAVELIATQSELAALVTAVRRGQEPRTVRVTSGWRSDLVGRELLELLAGRRSLVVEDGRLRVVDG
jgi:ribonuclease D